MIGANHPEERGCLEFPQEPGPCWGPGLRFQNCHFLGLRDSCPPPVRAAGTGGVSSREGNALQNSLESWLKMSTEMPSVAGRSLADGGAPPPRKDPGSIPSKKRSGINLCSEIEKASWPLPKCFLSTGRDQAVKATPSPGHSSSKTLANSRGTQSGLCCFHTCPRQSEQALLW